MTALRRVPISMYDRMCWSDAALERALEQGEFSRELTAYLGEAEYRALVQLARGAGAAQRAARLGRARRQGWRPLRVILLPGILGSQLGRRRRGTAPPDLLWLDPSDILAGRLEELRLTGKPPLVPLGAIVFTYLALKLRLRSAGLDVITFDYDWRAGLQPAAASLAALLESEATAFALVGHSMGGLVARAALARCASRTRSRLHRLIEVGTPLRGSIAAVQALRASYPVVGRLAALDPRRDPEWLTRTVFSGFPSLYELMPTDCGPDLFRSGDWPQRGPRPRRDLLARARATLALRNLPAGLPSQAGPVSIVGTGQRTATGIRRRGGQFEYEICAAGDGTVAAARATEGGAVCYSLRCEHSELPRHPAVAAAIVDLLREGRTQRLRAGARARSGRRLIVTDRALRAALEAGVDWPDLSAEERRRYLNRLNAPPAIYFPRA